MLNNINDLLLVAGQQEGGYEPYGETLQYVNLNGSQYFDTEVTPNPNLKIDVTFRTTGNDLSQNRCVFGGRISASGSDRKANAFWNIVSASGGYMRADYGNLSTGTSDIGTSSTTIDTWTNIVMDKGKVYLNGTLKYTFSNPFVTGTNPCSIIIGGMRSGTSSSSSTANFFIGDIQQAKIWDNDVLIRDYVPALDNKMQPCLYDKVSKTFLYAKRSSDGTTTYDLGFKRWNKYDVDYLQSTGTQYIDTGRVPNNTDIIEQKFCKIGDDTGTTISWYGSMPSATSALPRFSIGQFTPSGNTNKFFAGVNTTAQIANADNNVHTLRFYASSSTEITYILDGVENTERIISPGNAYSPQIQLTSYLFARHGTNGVQTYDGSGTQIYYHKEFLSDGTLVLDLKPSVRTYNDGTSVVTKAFMYDEVYNKAYDNVGTGSFKAYIAPDREVYNLSMHDTMDTNKFYLAEDGTKTVSSDGTSCYTEAIQVKEGDIIEWTVTAEAEIANKRIHGYSTNADITTGQKGSWVEMLAKIVFSTTSDTTQTASFVVPSGVNYIRLSHANVRETKDSIVRIRIYEVGKAIKYPQNNGFTLDAPDSSNFILDLLTRATTTNSYYILDTRQQTGGSSEDEFGIGGSSSGATVNWKCESESQLISTNGTNWTRTSNYTYSQLLVGYKDGNTFKRTASFYDFNNQRISDVTVVTATRDIANNTKPLTVLHTTSSNWLQNGADVHYFKYLQDDNDVWYDCIPVRNATLTSSVLLFDRANNTSLPNTGSGTPTFVALD